MRSQLLAALLSTLALSTASAAAPPAPKPAPAADLEGFLKDSVPFCAKAPAVDCVERGFAFADRDRSRRLSLEEARTTQGELNRWTKANARRLPPAEREKLVMGLLLLQTVGPERVFASYDKDGDGELTREEVTADIRLDRRPLPDILADPSSIDWDALSARAGEAAPLLRRLLQL